MTWDAVALFELLDMSVAVYEADSTCVYANPTTLRLFGLPRERLIGSRLWELFPDAIGNPFHAAFERVASTGLAESFDHYYPPFDRWFTNHIHAHDGKIHVVAVEITAQKRADARLAMLGAASEAFADALDPSRAFEALARIVAEGLGDACDVRVVDEQGASLRSVAVHHADPALLPAVRRLGDVPLRVGEGLTARVFPAGDELFVPRIDRKEHRAALHQDVFRDAVERFDAHSLIAVPLRDGDRAVGFVAAARDRTPRPYTDDDLSLLRDLGDRASMAIARARLYADNARALEAERRARLAAEQAAARTDQLQRLTAAFGAALTANDAARALAREGTVLGAAATFVWLVDEQGALALAAHEGYDGPALEPYRSIDLDAPVPVADAMRTRDVVCLEDRAVRAQRYPRVGDGSNAEFHAWAAVPLVSTDRAFGAFALSFREPRAFTVHEREFLRTIARQCVQTIERTRLFEAERQARAHAERTAERTRRLQIVAAQLSRRLSASEVADIVVRESAEALENATAAIWVLDDERSALRLLARFGPRANDASGGPVPGGSPLWEAIREARVVALERGDPRATLAFGGDASAAVVCLPLHAEGGVLGAIGFAFDQRATLAADERAFLDVLASQCAQALDRARLLDQERAATAALADANRTLSAIISASPAAIMLLELDGTVRVWNPAAERIFGWSSSEAIGRFLPPVSDEQRAELRANLAKVAAGMPVVGAETKRRTRDGRVIDVGLYAAPVQHPDGTVQCLSLVVDITDRKRAEEAARAADRRKDEFLAMLGHELRNPLAPLKTALQLLELRGDETQSRERTVIRRQVAHLERLVDDLLDVSRITRGKITLTRQPLEIAAVVADAIELVSPLLEQRRHHLLVDVPRYGLMVDGDAVRLAQVVANLLNNAAKYTSPGGHIRVRAQRALDRVVLRVSDDGIGISPETLPHVFELFVQERQAIDRSLGGLGLGLAIVRALVSMHGGDVAARSEGPGRGSEFEISLPVAASATAPSEHPIRGESPSHVERVGRRVLIVDDNEDAASMIALFLETEGFATRTALDGPSALSEAESFAPEIVLLDLGLPVMDGFEVARRLREMPKTRDAFIAAVTGYGQPEDRARTAAAGFDVHLVKPIDVAALTDMLLERARSAAS